MTKIQLLFICLLCLTSQLLSQSLTVQANASELLCAGEATGELFWTISGGQAPYTYEWYSLNNPFVFATAIQNAPGSNGPVGGFLSADSYIIHVTDALGIVALDTVVLAQPAPLQITGFVVEDASCANSCDGVISLEVMGGTGSISITWSDNPSLVTNSRNDLCAGSYIFYITDDNGCSVKGLIDIFAPDALELTYTAQSPTCAGGADGQLQANAIGGTGEIIYEWADGTQFSSLQNLSAGSYELTLSDANNCQLNTLLTVPATPALSPSPLINYGCGDGRILVSSLPANGTAPYAYSWSTGSAAPVIFGLSAGQYSLSVTDANGCIGQEDFTIDYVEPLVVVAEQTDLLCAGDTNGSITLFASGGQGPYQINWDNGATGASLNDLSGGEYHFNLFADGCAEAGSVQLYEPLPLTTQFIFTPQSDGGISAQALTTGGQSPYQYTWSTGSQLSQAVDLLPTQTYTLTVRDANNCEATFTVLPTLTSIAEHSLTSVTLSPNPTHDWLLIGDGSLHYAYRLFTANGQLVNSGFAAELLLTNLPVGSYYLALEMDGVWRVEQVVKL